MQPPPPPQNRRQAGDSNARAPPNAPPPPPPRKSPNFLAYATVSSYSKQHVVVYCYQSISKGVSSPLHPSRFFKKPWLQKQRTRSHSSEHVYSSGTVHTGVRELQFPNSISCDVNVPITCMCVYVFKLELSSVRVL